MDRSVHFWWHIEEGAVHRNPWQDSLFHFCKRHFVTGINSCRTRPEACLRSYTELDDKEQHQLVANTSWVTRPKPNWESLAWVEGIYSQRSETKTQGRTGQGHHRFLENSWPVKVYQVHKSSAEGCSSCYSSWWTGNRLLRFFLYSVHA